MTKKILIATFISKKDEDEFLDYILENFNLTKKRVFKYENLADISQYIFTFYIKLPFDEKINIRSHFKSGVIIHKKRTTFYTINALNKIIELECDDMLGNINYKDHKIKWENYPDRIIMTNKNNLVFIDLKQVF